MRINFVLALLVIGMTSAHATGFDLRYTVRSGYFNQDSLPDIYLRYAPSMVMIPLDDLTIPVPTTRRDVGEFVLINSGGGGFQLQGGLSAVDRARVATWTAAAAVRAIPGDFNADGYTDILLKNVSAVASGAFDQLVFASNQPGAVPSSVKSMDASFRQFLYDVAQWFNNKDRNHFASGFSYQTVTVQYPTPLLTWNCGGTYYNELQYSADQLSWCVYMGYRVWERQVRQYTFNNQAFSQLAIDLLLKLLPNFSALAPQSADASSIEATMESAMGTDFMRNLLSQGGSSDFLSDVFDEYARGVPGFPDLRIPSTSPDAGDVMREVWDNLDDMAQRSIPHIIVGILKDAIFASDLCDHGVRHDYYIRGDATSYASNTAGTMICPSGSNARCNLDYVFGREQLMHPAPGFMINNVPIHHGQVGIAQFGVPGPADDGGPVRFEVYPTQRLHRNIALPGHIWYEGAVERQTYLRPDFNQITIKTHGWGTGACSGFNEAAGIFVFSVLDELIRAHVAGVIPRYHE